MDSYRPNGNDVVRVWEESVEIPTYPTGEPEANPMFLEKRVYQGSSGRVYPYPVIESIEDQKSMKTYRIIVMENEYLHIEIMPEIGGRIYRALDKTNQYDFVYYNRVIKPALVGLAGPWVSGGIEINWPQHHRPNTFGPVEYRICENEDGSQTVWISEIDRMYGTKGMAGYTLYPGKAYLEIRGQLYNRTFFPQTFLWWANPAVSVHEETQSIFPPDVTAVFDHGKRDVSRFPIATGTYYKVDYSSGIDISWYKNIPVPTSYMVHRSDYDFVGGYDYNRQAGILHVADHHVSPGKKQWTWGNGLFGQAWDRNLTDEDGPYVELMTGVYTDNQPDFSWLQPNEEKTFTQVFMPYKNVGKVTNASVDAALGVEFKQSDNAQGSATTLQIKVYATSRRENAMIKVRNGSNILFEQCTNLSPMDTFSAVVRLPEGISEHEIRTEVRANDGQVLVSYQAKAPRLEPFPEAARPLQAPQEIANTEALYLAGLHLEQYRHATYEPDDYYLEALRREPGNIRINNAYGTLQLRRGQFKDAESCYRKAIETITRHNPNPYDGEPYFNLGRALKLQGRLEEAFSAFYKSTWNAQCQDTAFLSLAQIACEQGQYSESLRFVERSLDRNRRSPLARNLLTAVYRKLGQLDDAENQARETLVMDPTDFAAAHQLALILEALERSDEAAAAWSEYDLITRGDVHNVLALADDYASAGLYAEAQSVLVRALEHDGSTYPMLYYALGFVHEKMDLFEVATEYYKRGAAASPELCFPNTLWEYVILLHVLDKETNDARAHYYIGNWLYDKKRAQDAVVYWEASRRIDADFPIVHRNLGLAYYNKLHDEQLSLLALERAFSLDSTHARTFYELDQLYKKLGQSAAQRLSRMNLHWSLVEARDDLYTEYVTCLNLTGEHEQALKLIMSRSFHPWEGGEGKVTSQYVKALVGIAENCLLLGRYEEAIEHLTRALDYPPNLGEGKLQGAQDNQILYFLGLAYRKLGDEGRVRDTLREATTGIDEPSSAMFYNDQPPDTVFYQGLALLQLGDVNAARGRFNKLVDFGQKHLFDHVSIDYFAVSLPDFLVFDDDLDRRNQIHCHYMLGLGQLGLTCSGQGDINLALNEIHQVLELDANHLGATMVLSEHNRGLLSCQ